MQQQQLQNSCLKFPWHIEINHVQESSAWADEIGTKTSKYAYSIFILKACILKIQNVTSMWGNSPNFIRNWLMEFFFHYGIWIGTRGMPKDIWEPTSEIPSWAVDGWWNAKKSCQPVFKVKDWRLWKYINPCVFCRIIQMEKNGQHNIDFKIITL